MGMLERLKDFKEKLDIKEFYSDDEDYIFADGEMCFEVRGWGDLTGYQGMSEKKALEVQKNRVDYAVESMNALPHLLKEIEVLKEAVKLCLKAKETVKFANKEDQNNYYKSYCDVTLKSALAEAERIENDSQY